MTKVTIAKSVLCSHKNREMKALGRPTALTKEEELYVEKLISAVNGCQRCYPFCIEAILKNSNTDVVIPESGIRTLFALKTCHFLLTWILIAKKLL